MSLQWNRRCGPGRIVGPILVIGLLVWLNNVMLSSCKLNESEEGTPTATPTTGQQGTGTPSATPMNTPTGTADYTLGPEEVIPYDGDFLALDADVSGNLHLSYQRDGWVHYVHRTDGIWSEEQAVPDSGDAVDRFYTGIACGPDGTVHFVWSNADWNAVYYQSYLNGVWGGKETAISGAGTINRPDIDVAGNGDVYVVSQMDYGIAYGVRRGGTWVRGDYIWYSTPREPQAPRVAAAPDNSARCIFCSYHGITEIGQLGYSSFDPGSNTWTAPVAPVILVDIPGLPEIFVDRSGRSHIFWMEWTVQASYSKIGYSVLDNGQWSPVYYVIETPFIGFLDNEPHMHFIQGDGDVYCLAVPRFSSVYHNAYFYLKRGDIWSGPWLITTASLLQEYPALAFANGKFHYCWRDFRGSLYYRWIEAR
jgi:hypothetical protein